MSRETNSQDLGERKGLSVGFGVKIVEKSRAETDKGNNLRGQPSFYGPFQPLPSL